MIVDTDKIREMYKPSRVGLNIAVDVQRLCGEVERLSERHLQDVLMQHEIEKSIRSTTTDPSALAMEVAELTATEMRRLHGSIVTASGTMAVAYALDASGLLADAELGRAVRRFGEIPYTEPSDG